ncbi:glycosyltransferase [Paenibacillus senegalensis]|uniref:glycosyltransferase n=1 Tax=Paenibacillus senegalensis TaxID=1465766 RepID=UPI000288C21F|nr:glycosyltransferase [Paenibacillus senegalensis]
MIKKHKFIMIRFSVFNPRQIGWQIAKDVQLEEYKEKLYSNERLTLRQELFQKITLPSLLALKPDPEQLTLMVCTSQELPKKFLDELMDLLRPIPWAKIIILDSQKDIITSMGESIHKELIKFNETVYYSTTRLDDDDALAVYFMDELDKYLSFQYSDFCLSFASGFGGIYNGNSYDTFHAENIPRSAQGLTYINTFIPGKKVNTKYLSVFGLGSHTKVDRVKPTILDSRRPMFLRTLHSNNDSVTEKHINSLRKKPLADIEEVSSIFPLDIIKKSR